MAVTGYWQKRNPFVQKDWADSDDTERHFLQDEETSEVSQFQNQYGNKLSRDEIYELETTLLDKVYGNVYNVDETADDYEFGEVTSGVTDAWGLDIRRLNQDDLKEGDEGFPEMAYRGQIDWEFYQNDPNYKKLYSDYIGKGGIDLDDQVGITTAKELRLVRGDYKIQGISPSETGKSRRDEDYKLPDAGYVTDSGDWVPSDWNNAYKPTYTTDKDGTLYKWSESGRKSVVKSYQEKIDDGSAYLKVDTSVGGPKKKPITDIPEIRKPDIRINKVDVKRPANIPASWGSV